MTVLNLNKLLSIVLNYIYGIGLYKINYLLSRLGISNIFLAGDLNTYYKDILFYYLEFFIMSQAYIDRYITLNIKKLIDLYTYKGIRHQACLPVHGQRTRTNANTQRSKRRKIETLKK
jgi:small subunit ribosomal protein S13